MVGKLGCGCCTTEPAQLCTGAIYRNQIIEDYSPSFDPYFYFPTGLISNLTTENGYCRCAGFALSYVLTSGFQYGFFKKTTLAEPVESLLKLVMWNDGLYQGPVLPFESSLEAEVGIGRGGGGFQTFLNVNYSMMARAYWYNSEGFVCIIRTVTGQSFGALIPIRPKAGDVFGVRLSDFSLDTNVTWTTEVIPGKVEFLLNGEAVLTVTDTQYFSNLLACNFIAGIRLSEPTFIFGNYVFPHKIRVDDFTLSAL